MSALNQEAPAFMRGWITTLTSRRPSPLAKGNAQQTVLVEVRKIDSTENA